MKPRPLPRIGITMGDPTGIGPEIIIKVLSHPTTYQYCAPIVIGSPPIIQHALQYTRHPLKIRTLTPPPDTTNTPWEPPDAIYGTIDLLATSPPPLHPQDIPIGTAHPKAGEAAVKAIQYAVQLAMHHQLDAITTAPICKLAVAQAGYNYPGHTELLKALTNAPKAIMMLATAQQATTVRPEVSDDSVDSTPLLYISFVTSHLPLAEVPKHLTTEKIRDVIQTTHHALTQLGIPSPRLSVAALNPHAGEEGILGTEETEIITPAIQATAPLNVQGPFPADTLFINARERRWDAIIAMYHDQGSIPIKLMAFGNIVNLTLGLPIIRTSVDHGTAFDIAGKGIASENSLTTALKFAARLAQTKETEFFQQNSVSLE